MEGRQGGGSPRAMQQHGVNSSVATVRLRPVLLRPLLPRPALLAPLLLGAVLALPPRPALAAPASETEMDLYTRLAALNLCIARSAGVEFDLAVTIAAETISVWIQGSHDGAIAMIKEPLNLDQLRQGSLNSALLGAAELCPDQLPEAVLRDVQQAVKAASEPPARP